MGSSNNGVWKDGVFGAGDGVANRIAYWTGTHDLGHSADLTYDGTKLTIQESGSSEQEGYSNRLMAILDDSNTFNAALAIRNDNAGTTNSGH